jgi:hypothetical protein
MTYPKTFISTHYDLYYRLRGGHLPVGGGGGQTLSLRASRLLSIINYSKTLLRSGHSVVAVLQTLRSYSSEYNLTLVP